MQIREAIESHFEKEEALFNRSIKTLSLFFIDEVSKYRQYDEDGNELLGEYGKVFEQEYKSVLNEYTKLLDTPYQRYLKEQCSDVTKVHRGYFSIDKKGHAVNSELKRGSEFSDDISAYDLILKNKERLLSFDEPTRFIFSHSALREGWDNPNIFQICTLKHSDSQTAKRQEVGRGLRLCVDQNGNRMDLQSCGESIHEINKLTVIASESYRDFVTALQKDIKAVIYDRPSQATNDYFLNKRVKDASGTIVTIDAAMANRIEGYLIKNDYVDDDRRITDKYRADLASDSLAPLPEKEIPLSDGIHKLIQSIFDDNVLEDMVNNANGPKAYNKLNENFKKKEFQELWSEINHKYAYRVEFSSDELIEKSVKSINEKLNIDQMQYNIRIGTQQADLTKEQIEAGTGFGSEKSATRTLKNDTSSGVKYDLIGEIARRTSLTRRTTANILKGLDSRRLLMFRYNPEEFINKVANLINEQKATMIVERISYNQIEGAYSSEIFTSEKGDQNSNKSYQANKAITDYIYTDGYAENSDNNEVKFAKELDAAEEVSVYAKLPKGFSIPTPVGNYSPDWAIAFNQGSVKHIFFVAETKGTMNSMQLRPIEQAKISCAKKLFNNISTSKVRYHDVDSYESLLNIIRNMD